jgi:hypothetical protein
LRNILHALRESLFLLDVSIISGISPIDGSAEISIPAGAMPGRVRATMPLKDPLRRLPSNVTTFNVSDMIAPLHHDGRGPVS